MAHNLFQNKMAFVGVEPWHGLGTKVSACATTATMLEAAGLNWKVEKEPATGARVIRQENGRDVHERYFVKRGCVGDEKIKPVLGMVSPAYEVLQNDEAFSFFEPLLRADKGKFEAAGALGNGERVWVQFRVGTSFDVVPGDRVERFILLANYHDGRGALTLRFTPVRVVCQNTLNLASAGGEHVVNVRHSKHMRSRLADQEVWFLLQLVEDTFEKAAEQFALLARTQATFERHEMFLQSLFPQTKRQKERDETPKWWRAIDKVLANKQVTPASSAGTMWGLYNAVTHAEDFRKTSEASAEARLDRVWFGRGTELKIKALERAVELCGT